jgi:putative glutathione S-transferase
MGWVFPATRDEEPGAEPDPFNGAKTVRDLYEIASTKYTGKPTVPVSLDLGKNLFFCFIPFN